MASVVVVSPMVMGIVLPHFLSPLLNCLTYYTPKKRGTPYSEKWGTSYAFPDFLGLGGRNIGTPCCKNKSAYFLSSSLLIPACLRISSSVPFGRSFL